MFKAEYMSTEMFPLYSNRILKLYKMIVYCILLSGNAGTLFASAPSRPDVTSLKEVGVAYSPVSRTVFKSACSLPFSLSKLT